METKVNFYDHIGANKRNSFFLILCVFAMILFLGYMIGWIFGNVYVGVILAVFIALLLTAITFSAGDNIIVTMSGAKAASKKEHAYLINTVEGISIAAGITMPKVYVIEDPTINAFAIGKKPENASVAVTTGALKKLTRSELEGVLAHEISHIKNYDVLFMMITIVMIGVVVMLSDFLLRSFVFGGGKKREGHGALVFIALALSLLSPIAAYFIKLAVSRKREYLADANGALLTRHPQGLADALKKIKQDHTTPTLTANKAVSHLYFSNPFKKSDWHSTHPHIDDRIARLEKM